MRYFCTYCDRNYLSRALALHESLGRCCPAFTLWVLCFDAETLSALRTWKLPNLVPLALEDFEEGDQALLEAKRSRTLFEYYFTCTPSLVRYVLQQHSDIDVIAYLDADLFFFADPTPVYDELADRSILIIGHRFPEHLRFHETMHGVYNVGLLGFRNDQVGRAALDWWRERCLEKCSDVAGGGHFADQKYLDDWPTRFQNVVVSQNRGAGLAPWNVMQYSLEAQRGRVLVDGDALVFYHFHAVRMVRSGLFDACLDLYGTQLTKELTRLVYAPYLRVLQQQTRRVGWWGNPRGGNRVSTPRELVRFLVYGHSLFVSGPFEVRVHLEPLVSPLLKLRQALRSRQSPMTGPAR